MAEELGKAWFVRVQTMGSDEPIALEFAVGTSISQDAIAAVLDHPQVSFEDQVTSTAQLTTIEILSFKLRPDEVRTYGRRFYNASAGRWVPGLECRKIAAPVTAPHYTARVDINARRLNPAGFPFSFAGREGVLTLLFMLALLGRGFWRLPCKSGGPPLFAPSLNVQGDDTHNSSGFSVI